jgi:hypothetical protein
VAPSAPTSLASKTFRRRVRTVGLTYAVSRPTTDGPVERVFEDAYFGDEVELSAMEAMRLDSSGALAPPGATREDVIAERDAKIQAYRAARSVLPEGW